MAYNVFQIGFSLLQFIIYCTLLTIVTVLLMHFTIKIHSSAYTLEKEIKSFIQMYNAYDFLSDELSDELCHVSIEQDSLKIEHAKYTSWWYKKGDRLIRRVSRPHKKTSKAVIIFPLQHSSFFIKEHRLQWNIILLGNSMTYSFYTNSLQHA